VRGAYCLIMRLPGERLIAVGKNPPVTFPAGHYCYVGSAMNSLEKRTCRHASRVKKLRWHIDWLLEHAELREIKTIESQERIECRISRDVAEIADGIPMRGFGSSDCRTCKAHLYHFRDNPSERVDKLVRKWKSSLGHTRRAGKG